LRGASISIRRLARAILRLRRNELAVSSEDRFDSREAQIPKPKQTDVVRSNCRIARRLPRH
jgi:hypothetical protein